MANHNFPKFSLNRLLKTVFDPQPGERICILIDLDSPSQMKDFVFLKDSRLTVQRYAHDVFYLGLKNSVLEDLSLEGGEIFAYKTTGGSNLDLTDEAYDPLGRRLSLAKDIYPQYDIVLCLSTFSATAPLTAFAKQYNFRGATLHGLNQIIIDTGLSVDYNEVSRQAEKLRVGMTKAEAVEIDFMVKDKKYFLTIELDKQEAQKSHGIVRGKSSDVANLPAGEIYYVPVGAEGKFPMKFEEGTLAVLDVKRGRIVDGQLIAGDQKVLAEYLQKIKTDPATGELGELGFGTQVLPFSGRDIQDEKILGTFHLATGRSDHLGGHLTPDKFKVAQNATHDDILFAPHKTPEINVPQVRLRKDGQTKILIEHYQPADYIKSLLLPPSLTLPQFGGGKGGGN